MPGDRTGRFLYVAHGDGGTILRFDVAGGAGKVTLALEAAQTGSPVCIVFRDADLRFRQGSGKNLGRYAASGAACRPKRPSSTAALTWSTR